MGIKLISTKTQHNLNPGETGHYWWNHASPPDAVWSANAMPVATGSTDVGFDQDTTVEVTRLWRRFTVIEKSHSQISDTDVETEIHYEVKNLGSTKARFVVYLSVVS